MDLRTKFDDFKNKVPKTAFHACVPKLSILESWTPQSLGVILLMSQKQTLADSLLHARTLSLTALVWPWHLLHKELHLQERHHGCSIHTVIQSIISMKTKNELDCMLIEHKNTSQQIEGNGSIFYNPLLNHWFLLDSHSQAAVMGKVVRQC